jgi:glycosyltransferase involved in cell wall biosynthesis
MKLSIIIPTVNRYNDLNNTLIDLSHQTHTDFEVIIIDQTPIGKAQIITNSELLIHYYHSEIPSASFARNIGIQEAKGEIVLFLDDDVLVDSKTIEILVNQYICNENYSPYVGFGLAIKNTNYRNLNFLSKLLLYFFKLYSFFGCVQMTFFGFHTI